MRIATYIFAFLFISVCQSAYGQDNQDKGLDGSTFDRNVRPQDDLYLAVNGRWLNETEIPSDKSNFGSFIVLADEAQEQIRDLIESAAAGEHAEGSDAQKVGDFFKSYMDTRKINQLGITPLADEIKKIENLKTHQDIVRHFGYMRRIGAGSPIGFVVTQDDKNSTQYICAIYQSGTSLPDRDYYLDEQDEKYAAARAALAKYVDQLFVLAGFTEELVSADAIVQLERKLAEVQWTRTEIRDANKRYNKYAFEDLAGLASNIDWTEYFQAAGLENVDYVNVMTPSFFEGLNEIITDTPVEIWRQYLIFNLIDAFATVLSEEFVNANFELYDKTLAGIPEQKPRWKKAVDTIGGGGPGDFGALGDVLGKMYVEKHFPPEHKARMDELVQNLLKAYGESIGDLKWMTDVTKEKAQEKLSKINTKIGYPDKWRSYDALVVKPDDLIGNVRRSVAVEYNRMLDKLGKPVDRDEWGMSPYTVNAYYNPGMNEIVFPAAILQPPFFNMDADDAINYGGIGAVIGHEISHAFDDQGSKYDGDGNLNNWWTDKDRESFRELTTRLIAQYEKYEPLPGKYVNGQLTLGENIADLSGLSIAFKAYQLSLDGEEPEEVAGWSGNQRFFLGWSQVWRRKYRDAEMVRRLLIDPHAPSWYRANGPCTNIDAFYEAFDVKSGDKLFKPKSERIEIW